ncbi:hypothetical protein [Streptomyces lydicus]|uniref:hypothetical protein n=1 Tax=Streptomyces lydicus TaxID=47763 RepID=UPI0037B9D460
MELVVGGAEEEFSFRNHPLQHADGVDHRRDRDPGHLAYFTSGDVVAVVVGDGLVVMAVDQVLSLGAVSAWLGVGAAAGTQSLHYWREGVIPSVHYSS